MTPTSSNLAGYLDRALADWRRAAVYGYWRDESLERYLPCDQRPSVEELAAAFLADAELSSLKLANYTQTPVGELFVAAVEQVSPPFLRSDERLIVSALHLAVQMQQRRDRRAGLVALGAMAALAWLLWVYATS